VSGTFKYVAKVLKRMSNSTQVAIVCADDDPHRKNLFAVFLRIVEKELERLSAAVVVEDTGEV
jgi:hypothetical protein